MRAANTLRIFPVGQIEAVAVNSAHGLEHICELLHFANLRGGKKVNESLLPGEICTHDFPTFSYWVPLLNRVHQASINQAVERGAAANPNRQNGDDHCGKASVFEQEPETKTQILQQSLQKR